MYSVGRRDINLSNNSTLILTSNQSLKKSKTWVLTIDENTNRILKIDSVRKSDELTQKQNEEELEQIKKTATTFLSYDIAGITIDSNSNVLIMRDGQNLIRFSNLQYKTKEYERWHHIKGYWFGDNYRD